MLVTRLFLKFIFKVERVCYHTRRKLLKKVWTAKLKNMAQSYGKGLRVNGKSTFTGKIYLGENVNFNGIIIQGNGTVKIGDNFRSGIECMIITQNHDYDVGETLPFGRGLDYKTVTIGDNVWMGNRVTVTGDTHIGEGAVIAAGALVCKDVPPLAIVGGNPARVLKYRDREHYFRLKEEKKFHNSKRKRFL